MSNAARKARKKARIPAPIKPAKVPTPKRGKLSNKPLSLEVIQAYADQIRAEHAARNGLPLGSWFGR